MDFESATKRYRRLIERYHKGHLTEEQLKQAVDQLAITDEHGNLWQIGIKSGKWYRFEDQHWVEATPPFRKPSEERQLTPEKRQNKPLIKIVGMLFLIGVLLSCLVGAVYFAGGNWDQLGDVFSGNNSVGNQEGAAQASDQPDDPDGNTPSGDQLEEEPTQRPTPESSPMPTATQPAPTQPALVEPQVWALISGNDFNTQPNLSGVWESVPDRDWEWEFLKYAGLSALYLQFSGEQEFIYNQDTPSAWEIEAGVVELDLALPEQDAQVFLVCRLQEETGDHYALKVTNSRWWVVSVIEGEETILAQGKTSEAFSARNPERFRFECSGSTLEVFGEEGRLALLSVQDDLDQGALAVRFSAGTGIGRIYLMSEHAMTLTEDFVGSLLDAVRLESLSLSLSQSWRIHEPLTENEYQGQDLVSLEVMVENFGGQFIEIKAADVYLQQGGIQVYALDFIPKSAVDPNPLEFPVKLQPGGRVSGEVYFTHLTELELSDEWVLVIDLADQGLGVAQFQIPQE